MLLRRTIFYLAIAMASASAQVEQDKTAATIIADCCSTTIALIHTALDAAISQAIANPEHSAEYISVSLRT
jgi:hypothetical protein